MSPRKSGRKEEAGGDEAPRDATPAETRSQEERRADGGPEKVSLVLSPAVVADIVRREVLNAPGVTEIASSSFIGRSRGISVSEEPGGAGEPAYKVEINIYVEFGTDCPKLKDVLARRIAASVKKMTGRDVLSLDVTVEGVRDPVPEEDVPETPDTPMIDY